MAEQSLLKHLSLLLTRVRSPSTVNVRKTSIDQSKRSKLRNEEKTRNGLWFWLSCQCGRFQYHRFAVWVQSLDLFKWTYRLLTVEKTKIKKKKPRMANLIKKRTERFSTTRYIYLSKLFINNLAQLLLCWKLKLGKTCFIALVPWVPLYRLKGGPVVSSHFDILANDKMANNKAQHFAKGLRFFIIRELLLPPKNTGRFQKLFSYTNFWVG